MKYICGMIKPNLTLVKWIGTVLLLGGVTLNTLNTPQWQDIVYPYNLYVSLLGSISLFIVAKCQKDVPYQILNLTVMVMYLIGIWNAWCHMHGAHIFLGLEMWPLDQYHKLLHF